MQLAEWQKHLQQAITASSANEADMSLQVLYQYSRKGGVDAETRIGIYGNAYYLRLIEVLQGNYPAIHQILGDADFAAMARRYIVQHPPQHASVRWFGEHLAAFLDVESPFNAVPILVDLARFEWAFRHAIDAADAQVVTAEQLHMLDVEVWTQTVFALHPSLTLLPLEWNAPQVCQALVNEQHEPPLPDKAARTWIVYRQPDMVCAWRSLDSLEKLALELLVQGNSFADMCEYLVQYVDAVEQVPPLAAGFFRGWVEAGLLVQSPR